MKLEVKNLALSPVGTTETLSIEMFNEQFEEDVLVERIKGTVALTRLEDQILASLTGMAKTLVRCDRCAGDFVLEVPLKFSEEYWLTKPEAEAEALLVSRDFYLDIREPLRQEILASLPVKKLCDTDCKGLCIQCGTNLNQDECQCKKH